MTLSKPKIASITGLALLGLYCSSANATILPTNLNGFYVGAFGGYGAPEQNHLSQTGTAFFPAASGGPLNVHARSESHEASGGGFGGLHIGYEWAPVSSFYPAWLLVPAAEFEAYYLGVTEKGALTNPTPRLPEHDFHDSFPMHTWVMMANSVWALKIPQMSFLMPYAGVGLGTADVSISGADSTQVSPAEPGINHFNSKTHASNWGFAVQAKAGLRVNIDCHWRVFAEYRYLYIGSTNYTFGSTQYPTHVPTTNWNVGIGGMSNNMGALGVEYSF